MNKGIIYKIKVDFESKSEVGNNAEGKVTVEVKKFHCYIKLERTVKIKDDKTGKETEYNIFIIKTNDSAPEAKLVPIEDYFTCDFAPTILLNKQLEFGIDWNKRALISVEYEA